MTATKDGGDAFPSPGVVLLSGHQQGAYQGMTLRDYFAAEALQAQLARTTWGVEDDYRDMALEAYAYADAMLKAREA